MSAPGRSHDAQRVGDNNSAMTSLTAAKRDCAFMGTPPLHAVSNARGMSTGRAGAGHESAGNRGPIGAIASDAVTRGAGAGSMALMPFCIMTAAGHPPRPPLRQPGSDTTPRKFWHISDAA